MRKYEWNEEQIEQLLQHMPLVKDNRSKQVVYQRISIKMKKNRGKNWIIPSIASTAAVLLFIVIGSSYITSRNETYISQEKSTSNNEQDRAMMMEEASQSTEVKEAEKQERILSRVVSEVNAEHQEIVVFGIPNKKAEYVIPVSVLVNKDSKSYNEHFQQAKELLSEEEWGLSESMIDSLTITSIDGDKTVAVNVPRNHPAFHMGSAGELMFLDSVEETFRWAGVKEVKFMMEGKRGIELPHTGPVDSLPVHAMRRGYFLYQLDRTYPVFLTPAKESFSTLQAALDEMDDQQTLPLRPSIPKEVKIESIQVNGNEVTIQFSLDTQLKNTPETVWMLEAILLTAKEFGFTSVVFTGGNVEQIGDYTFNEKINVPLAPNPMPMN
jgi:hypothetical protein